MIDKIKNHINELKTISIQSVEELEKFRLKFLGKKGLLTIFFSELRKIPQEQKKEYGREWQHKSHRPCPKTIPT